ncbi:kinesin-like protein KIN-7E [Impatiens glandulifera]|uniref:kinesin-like protein KIN-7E n=1 Tax=Impatiens glandulifera TaxID=253017 RepID=UPI001FB16FBC|nr:kinesin-like protein KIN-7E [Impatiens glandulifera]
MGEIGEDELLKWEKKMQGGEINGGEEKIFVLIRLRPLSDKEINRNEVSEWECINETTILYRNSLQERSGFPSAYRFDRVFGGDNSTRQVYDEGAKDIALSVVTGINSTIFAYGQTSSGKTYTMIGITEYTVADIYDYIHKHQERAFVLKFSAMEIYNEAVRDLLTSDNTPLRLLDDPEKGTVVEKLTEETLRDWNHLKELLSICDAQRKIGETSLNETSSRSHQIIRLTVESSAHEFIGKDKSTTLVASVNFVDLAGSERASQAHSVGVRLKEGCHINRSLLTLSTVIRKLSNGRNGHINYRDSKLTRILQPSLGGNARTAIICTLCPVRSHVEQSRNTLLFASCAKEVTTNAKVNVVMSDKALVKHLQKELARLEGELRAPITPSSSTCNCSTLLRKKDLQIERLEKEVQELTRQKDVAESRVGVLHFVGNDEAQREQNGLSPTWKNENEWEDEYSASESSGKGKFGFKIGEYSDSTCKDVPCIEMDDKAIKNGISEPSSTHSSLSSSSAAASEGEAVSSLTDSDGEEIESSSNQRETNKVEKILTYSELEQKMQDADSDGEEIESSSNQRETNEDEEILTYSELEQKMQDVQKTIDSLSTSPYNDSTTGRKLRRSWSFGNDVIMMKSSTTATTTPRCLNTPPLNDLERSFAGRPKDFLKMEKLVRNDSQSSIGSVVNDLRAQDMISAEEEIPSVDSFVAGLKEMAKQAQETKMKVKDIGLDPMQDDEEKWQCTTTSADWPSEFERQRKSIIALWKKCNISLIHRTYFFLLFKGDSADSVYLEVEFRRLTFLAQEFSQGSNHSVGAGLTLTLSSSEKDLLREKEMLCRFMYKRLTRVERNKLYQKWGISLDSKRRRVQLMNRLWSDENDMNQIKESAAIVAKLIKFSEKEGALKKQIFGLISFTPPRTNRRRSFGWMW